MGGMARSLAFVLALSLSAHVAQAESLDDRAQGSGDKGTDMVIDLLVLRPLGLVTTGIGSVLFLVSLPFTLPSGSVGESACELVSKPLAYTFSRPLGEVGEGADRCGKASKP